MRKFCAHTGFVVAMLFCMAISRIGYTQTVAVTFVSKISLCAGDSLDVTYNVSGGPFHTTNVFRVQLSDSAGNFTSSTVIGARADSSGPGVIQCTVPTSALGGKNYRVRIFADSPIALSVPNAIPLQIDEYPVISASNNGPICEGDTLIIGDMFPTDPEVSYFWTGPITFTKHDTTIYNASKSLAGTYQLTAVRGGCLSGNITSVVIDSTPSKPNISAPSTVCSGTSLVLSATPTPGASYQWSGPGGFNPTNPTVAINGIDTGQAGTYIISASLPSGCVQRDTHLVTVVLSPAKPVAQLAIAPACSGKSLSLIATNITTSALYTWSGPGGLTDTGTNASFSAVTTANTGNFIVQATGIGGCTARDTILIIVNPKPQLTALSADTTCIGDSLVFIAGTDIAGSSFNWFDTLGYNITTNDTFAVRINTTIAFGHTYFVAATSPAGCISDTGSVVAVVLEAPAQPQLTANSPVCAGKGISLSANSATAGVTYTWAGPNGFSTSGQDVYRPVSDTSMSGSYSVTVSLGKCTASANADIVVKPFNTPAVTISADPGVQLTKMKPVTFRANAINAGSAPQYQWRKNGADIPGATNEMYAAVAGVDIMDNDLIGVRITSNAECPFPDSVASYVFTVDINTDINDVNVINDLVIYPNPSYGTFHVKGTINAEGPVEIRVINIAGDVVYKGTATAVAKAIDYPVSVGGIASGIYLLQLQAGDQVVNLKFSVRK